MIGFMPLYEGYAYSLVSKEFMICLVTTSLEGNIGIYKEWLANSVTTITK
jgi:hypothetical protein